MVAPDYAAYLCVPILDRGRYTKRVGDRLLDHVQCTCVDLIIIYYYYHNNILSDDEITKRSFWIRQYPYKSNIFCVIDILADNFHS